MGRSELKCFCRKREREKEKDRQRKRHKERERQRERQREKERKLERDKYSDAVRVICQELIKLSKQSVALFVVFGRFVTLCD